MADNTYAFDLPTHHKSIIKVVGVGGGGSNAVNHMFGLGIKDVEFVVANTDRQALESSPVPNKLQIGTNLTSGLGAGANPEKGRNAAIESKEDIKDMLAEDTKMVFITAGMGGGTGTGGAPVIAQVAKELDILTVGIVTAPFGFEGKKKRIQAEEGIRQLKKNCDTVIVISNDKIKEIYGNLAIREAFAQADNVLTTAAKGIAEIITVPGYVNVDFEDVKTVMLNAGAAVMGSASTSGENRARRAAEAALNSPLLNNENIHGADKILLSIMSGEEAELQMDELTDITDYIEEFAGSEAEVIFGHGVDPALGDNITVTVIATGFDTVEPEMVLKTKESEEEEEELVEETVNHRRLSDEIREKPEAREDRGRTVFDLESSREIEQRSLFEEDEDPEEEEEVDYNFDFDTSEEESDKEEERTFEFEFDFTDKEETPEPEEKDEEEFAFELDHDFNDSEELEMDDEGEEEDMELEELEGSAHPMSHKLELMEARRKREEMMEGGMNKGDINPQLFKEKWDVPAYERKKVKLHQVPHSSERNISKFNLTDDNQIVGNNRFLHDNVD